jgi:DNA-binding beta-propeller fold protein YncE
VILLALAHPAPAAVAGSLVQKPGPAGCISETGAGGCQDGAGVDAALAVAVSPDGASVYSASYVSDAIAVFDRDPATGALTQRPGTAGCISETGAGGCQDGAGLDGVRSVALSPDGRSVYAAAVDGNAVAVFDRDPATGALTQKPLPAGCIAQAGAGGCQSGAGLSAARSVAVSPDGTSAYVASVAGDAIAVFDRDPATGALTQKPLPAGCVAQAGAGGCQPGRALDFLESVTVSPDGRSVYAAALLSDAVTVFDRDPATGALTQKPGRAGCISETGDGGLCQDGAGLNGALAVTVSPDGVSVYTAASNSEAVAAFDRDPATGALTQKAGLSGCISETGAGGCRDGSGLAVAESVVVSPDGTSVYTAANTSDAVAVFDRDPATGALTQKPLPAGCIAETAVLGCQDGTGFDGAGGVAVSPDGASVYAAAQFADTIVVLDRRQAPLCAPGATSVGHAQVTTLQLACLGRGAPVTGYQVVQAPAVGLLGPVAQALGQLTYTPPAGFSGPVGLTYTASSLYGTSLPAPLALTVQPALTGPPGPAGAAGPAGPQGAAGPPGLPGPAGAAALGLATATRALRVEAGRKVRVQYLTTAPARVAGELRQGRRIARRLAQQARRGLNTLSFTTPRTLAPGRYTLALSALSGRQRATATLALTVTRPAAARRR